MSFFSLFSKNKNKINTIGIVPDKETQKLLARRDKETIDLFLKILFESSRFNKSIEMLVTKNIEAPFNAIAEGNLLSLEQKKALNINGRKKYGDKYIESLTETGLNDDASVEYFKNSYHQAFGIASRKFEIEKIKRAGITKCRIASCNDDRDCEAVKNLGKKVFDINSVPDLPLPECNAAYCRCMIVAVLD